MSRHRNILMSFYCFLQVKRSHQASHKLERVHARIGSGPDRSHHWLYASRRIQQRRIYHQSGGDRHARVRHRRWVSIHYHIGWVGVAFSWFIFITSVSVESISSFLNGFVFLEGAWQILAPMPFLKVWANYFTGEIPKWPPSVILESNFVMGWSTILCSIWFSWFLGSENSFLMSFQSFDKYSDLIFLGGLYGGASTWGHDTGNWFKD